MRYSWLDRWSLVNYHASRNLELRNLILEVFVTQKVMTVAGIGEMPLRDVR